MSAAKCSKRFWREAETYKHKGHRGHRVSALDFLRELRASVFRSSALPTIEKLADALKAALLKFVHGGLENTKVKMKPPPA
jgi:hypothetical protein